MSKEDVLKLAENLKRNGLAASQEEAIRKAKLLLGVSFTEQPEQKQHQGEDIDITKENKPIKDLFEEAGIKVDIEAKRMPYFDEFEASEQSDLVGAEPEKENNPQRKYAEEDVDLVDFFK